MDIISLIAHPKQLNKDTLYELRQLVAQYPYFQVVRLLFLKNLFLLHDPSFGEELRRAALYIPDRSVLFKMVEGDNYEIRRVKAEHDANQALQASGDRTESLIDKFLRTTHAEEPQPRRELTIADATTDYAAFLLQMDDAEPEDEGNGRSQRSLELIDDYIGKKPERIVLQEEPEYTPEIAPASEEQGDSPEEDFFTETLAKIYIKQGRYEKALEIIRKLNLNYPKKNIYFADQIRFLQKLIINNKHQK